MKRLAALFAIVLLLPATAHAGWFKFSVPVRRPAATPMPGVKTIAVMSFHSPTGRFGGSVSSELQSRLVANCGDNFKIVDQGEVKKLLETQRAGQSGVFDETTVAETGKLLGADALVFGAIDDDSKFEDQTVLTQVTKYKIDTGEEYVEKCPTVIRSAHMGVTFKVLKVETGQVMAHDHRTYNMKSQRVSDPNPKNPYVRPGTNAILAALIDNPFKGQLTPDEAAQQQLAEQAAIDFSKLIMPYSENVLVEWDTAVAPTDALKLLQATLFSEAREVMEKAVAELEPTLQGPKNKHKLGGLYYDTGVAFELEGRLDEALNWYKKAIIAGDDDRQVKDAIMRVKTLVTQSAELQNQTVR